MKKKFSGLLFVFMLSLASCASLPPEKSADKAPLPPQTLAPATSPAAPPVKPLEKPPEKPPVITQQPRILDELKDYHSDQDAGRVLAKIEKKIAPEQMNPSDVLVYGNLLLADKRFKDAEKIFASLLVKNPRDKEALLALALIHGTMGDAAAQKNDFEKALTYYPEDPEVNSVYGNVLLLSQQPDKAKPFFEKALKKGDNADALAGLAQISMRNKDWQAAIDLLARGLALDPTNDTLLAAQSQAYSENDQPYEAEKAISKAIDSAPQFTWHYLDRARLSWLKLYKTDQATADLNKVLTLDPQNFFGLIYRGEIREAKDDVDGAYEDYQAALDLRPDYRYAYPPMAVLAFNKKDWERAQKYAQEAFKDYPGEYAFPLIAGLALKQLGRPEEAKKALEAGYKKFPQGSLISEAIRFMLNPRSDFNLNAMILTEKDATLKARIQLYQACQYWFDKQPKAAKVIFDAVAELKIRNVPEIRMARSFTKEIN